MTIRSLLLLILLFPSSGWPQTIFTKVTEKIDIPFDQARGAIFGDYDNDGQLDIFLAERFNNGSIALLHNDDGTFAEATDFIQADIPDQRKGGGTLFGDYDNDGDLDLFISIGDIDNSQRHQNVLLRNDRGVFTDVTLAAGLNAALPTDNAVWLDYDLDGHLDLYTGNLGCDFTSPINADGTDPTVRNRLYRNNGDGTFSDATSDAGLDVQLTVYDEENTPHCAGGSQAGIAAADFDDDGFPDLYLAVQKQRNRLFLNNGRGGFDEATTDEIDDDGEAQGIAVGDYDNDGDMDIFQAAGGAEQELQRSRLLQNLGEGLFIDVTPGVGLSILTAEKINHAKLADIDNDGDLDLLTGSPHFLFINDGTFTEATSLSGFANEKLTPSIGDFDRDGFLDILFGGGSNAGLFRNNGNNNHWLRVELVGIQSNRNGIGARLTATAGDLSQTRQLLGGLGLYQDELVVHFGLGDRTQVDRLAIQWPSGQVDELNDVAADQMIRVFEGRPDYHVVQPTRWEGLPDTVAIGTRHEVRASVRPALFEASAQITRIVADLSALGGPSALQIAADEEGRYELETTLEVDGPNGFRELSVLIEQSTSRGPHWIRLAQHVLVLPAADLLVFGDALAEAWFLEMDAGSAEAQIYGGRSVLALQTPAFWNMDVRAVRALEPAGYIHLQFAFHPGMATVPRSSSFSVVVNGRNDRRVVLLRRRTFDDIGIDMEVADWQLVKIPLDVLVGGEAIASIRFSGNLEGVFYLDDIRLVAAQVSPSTAVLEQHSSPLPRAFALEQNYPNPFNSDTIINFALPNNGKVDLSIYNATGQKVATLISGTHAAGSYSVRWNGRSSADRELASGVYIYRLEGSGEIKTRKLILIK